MLSELRKLAWDYNCFVFPVYDMNLCYQIYSLDIDKLTECMKAINNFYDLKWLSDLFSSDDLKGVYYFIEF